MSSVPKSLVTEFRLELSAMLLVVFSFLTIIGVVGVFLKDDMTFLSDIVEPVGSWAYWLVVVGPLGVVGAGWWLYDYVKKTKKLAGLIDTPSKAKFVRNIDDIEYLGWSLPQRFQNEVLKKKRDFGL